MCADGGVQSEVRSCGQCSEGWGERSCCEGSGGLSDPALENRATSDVTNRGRFFELDS